MPYVEVEVDLDDFSDRELIQELEHRGYRASKGNPEFSWLKASPEEDELADLLWDLRQAYIIENGDQFRKSFEKILAEFGYYV